MKKVITLILVIVSSFFFFERKINAASIDTTLAQTVASNFLNHLGQVGAGHQIESVVSVDLNGERVGFLVKLTPQGYILVAGNNIRVPVKAYSLKTSFAELPQPYVDTLRSELSLPDTAVTARAMTALETTNSAFWDFLTSNSLMMRTEVYTPDTFLLTSKWNQQEPYNNFYPMVGDQRTITGCTQVAVAQVMRYHNHPAQGSGVFTHSWNGQILTAIMARPYNWDIMVDTPHTSPNHWEQDEVAALMLDLGILNQAYFGVYATSTGFNYNGFRRAYGYAPIYTMSNGSPEFFDTIRSEIDNLRPVLLSIPGHMTVADGYSSDPTGRNIHVNMGWGGAYDDFYYLDETIVAGGYSFEPNHAIFYNIKPCLADECLDSFPAAGNNQAPEFVQSPSNIAVNSDQWVRLDVRDPDGDSVSVSAYSTCVPDQLALTSNLLPLQVTEEDQFCQITVFGTSHDGSTAATFKTLAGSDGIYRGEQLTVGGQFEDIYDVDEYTIFLSGETTISGNRGYSNQAFYIWVKDDNGVIVVPPDSEPVSVTLPSGYYTLTASLNNQYGAYYYYNPDYSDYVLSIVIEASLDDIAAYSGLSLSECQLSLQTGGDGSGRVTSLPGNIDCGGICSESVTCSSTLKLTAEADEGSHFTNWSGDCSGTETSIFFRVEDGSSCIANYAVTDEEAIITASSNGNGSISPSGQLPLILGNSAQFTLSADLGFEIENVTGTCSGSLIGNVFTTDPINADCSVIANFVVTDAEATITSSSGGNGSISPSGQLPIVLGNTTQYTLSADLGYVIDGVTGTCGGNLVDNVFTTNPISTDCTVIANFALTTEEATITSSSVGAGSISPSGQLSLVLGNTSQFTLSADLGYVIDGVTGTCGGDLIDNVFTTDPISTDCSVIANFVVTDEQATITASTGGNGGISPSGQIPFALDNSARFTLRADPGYVIEDVTGTCGGDLVDNVFITDPISVDCTVIADFLLKGDINKDGSIDLRDAIIGLKILSGMPITEEIAVSADIDGDGYLSLPEIMYIFDQL